MLTREIKENFEMMRAIVLELQGQVTWGPIGQNEQLTKMLRDSLQKNDGVADHFKRRHHSPRIGGRDCHFTLKDGLSAAQLNDLHQFVIDVAEILIKHLHICDVSMFIKFSSNNLQNPNCKINTDDVAQIKVVLESMLQVSKVSLKSEKTESIRESLKSPTHYQGSTFAPNQTTSTSHVSSNEYNSTTPGQNISPRH